VSGGVDQVQLVGLAIEPGRVERGSTVWVNSRMRSASVDLPWSMWAMIEKFLMWAWSVKALEE
jgi:hypothetical protein